MTKDDLIAHLHPLVERVTDELATVLWNQLEQQLGDAFEVARSALASDLCRVRDPAAMPVSGDSSSAAGAPTVRPNSGGDHPPLRSKASAAQQGRAGDLHRLPAAWPQRTAAQA